MRRRELLRFLCAATAAWPLGAKAQEPKLLTELLPGISRVAVLWNAGNPYSALVFAETVGTARILGIELQSLEVRAPADFEGALEAITGSTQLP
jgi:putative tryptophan/tyrosine transport system substrate-binding protein